MSFKNIFYRITHWETWGHHIKYIPLYPVWLWHCLRSRSLWFFTPSNPTLTFGGFEGESKREMYDQLPEGSYPNTIYISPSLSFEQVEVLFLESRFQLPVAVKPDVGMKGYLFRKIDTIEELKRYHEIMPVDYIIQDLIAYPIEVSVFYYRFPDQASGTVSGFCKKEHMQVVGDGRSTLRELLLNYAPARFKIKELALKHTDKLEAVIPSGEVYMLSAALNLSRGGRMVSLKHEIDEKLLKVFDDLSHYTRQFYYGRYDIKCASVEDLRESRNFSILEYNGSGAEPHHIYGDSNSLWQAYKILLHHWNILYKISRYNYRKGIIYWNFKRGWFFLKKAKQHFRLLAELDTRFSNT